MPAVGEYWWCPDRMMIDPQSKRILVADDEETIRRLLEYNLTKWGYEPVLAADGREAISLASEELLCALVDLKMPEADGIAVLEHLKKTRPELPVIVMSAVGQVKDAVAAMKKGAFEYVTKPFALDELRALTASATRLGTALRENRELREAVSKPPPDAEFAGTSRPVQNLRELVTKIAAIDSTVLIMGETGVGKGLLARMIHRASRRHANPFVTASCPALPRELLESEMFGHEKGAFTGAHQRRIGRIEMARGGTLFLDEIGDLPLLLQPKLLTVLQDRQFQRLGGSTPLSADVRLIAATNIDLQERVQSKEFREDLYYRLAVIPILIPPLRERLEDVAVLTRQILARIATARQSPPLDVAPETMGVLQAYPWPGNVRELENILERASAFCDGETLRPKDLPPELSRMRPSSPGREPGEPLPPKVGGWPLEELEKLAIRQTLELHAGNKAAAARTLGITEKTIYNKMTRLGLR